MLLACVAAAGVALLVGLLQLLLLLLLVSVAHA